ncbi:MAG: DUF6391 domain-containing protein [Acidobacteriota bacterium]
MRLIEKAEKSLLRFLLRPLTGSISYMLVVVFVLFVPRRGPNLMLFYIVLPWLLIGVIALNMSFISMVFRRFTLSEAIKRNHALEHGTVFLLRRRFGGKARIGGLAEANGFRVCGVQKKEHVLEAFEELIQEFGRGNSQLIISMRCGTNIAVAQGLGIILLSFSTVLMLLSEADRTACLVTLSFIVLLYFLLRTGIGNWVQSRFFLSLAFSNARIQSIYRVEKKRFWERNPVFFVKTVIS